MSEPLSYGSMTTILEKTEANKRFEVARQCPSIDKAERATPLWIDYLKLQRESGPSILKINGTTYTIGTVRVYPERVDIPSWHETDNERGGVFHDFDQFGMNRENDDSERGPQMEPEVDFDWEQFEWDEMHFHGQSLYIDYRGYRRSDYPDLTGITMMYKNDGYVDWIDSLQSSKEELQNQYNTRDNRRVPYKPMSQLTVESPNGEKRIKRSSKKLHECENKLFKRLFANRKSINVQCLEIDYPYDIPNFHSDLKKLKVQELKLGFTSQEVLDSVEQLIDNVPLKKVTLKKYLECPEHNIIKSAETLEISHLHGSISRELRRVENRKVIFREDVYEENSYSDAIRRWIEKKHPIGSYCSVILKGGKAISRTMKELESDGIRSDQRCVNIQNDDGSMVRVTYEPDNSMDRVTNELETEPTWSLKWEVVAS
uniref:Smr domain-containing protein n=1 Tax=Caenorhabditis tropicalis TaxID=1561998 RepID=A0A1I7TCI8_9PELO